MALSVENGSNVLKSNYMGMHHDLEKSMRISPKSAKKMLWRLPKVCAKKGHPSTTHYVKSDIFVQ